MLILRLMTAEVATDATRPKIAAYGGRLYRKRYQRLGWRAREGDSSDTKLMREADIRFMVMEVRDRKARARAVRLGYEYAGFGVEENTEAVDPQLVALVLAAAVQEGEEAFFEHLLARLHASADATARARILNAIGHADTPALSDRALALALDPELRLNEISGALRIQFANPQTRERAWAWLKDNFDAFVERASPAQAGGVPWYTASFCTSEAADDVQAFFENRVAGLFGGPRNLASAVEAIRLCAARADAQRPGVERAFR